MHLEDALLKNVEILDNVHEIGAEQAFNAYIEQPHGKVVA
jgi:hypothetical protein